jgi:hypothetical protein
MLYGEGETIIRRSPEDILEFVLDLDQYKKADRKFGKIKEVERNGHTGYARYSARLRGIPTPADIQSFELADDYSTLRFVSTPKFWPNVVATFEGRFECRPEAEGTHVRHVEQLTFARPVAWIAEPLLRKWWATEIRTEVERMRTMLEDQGSA